MKFIASSSLLLKNIQVLGGILNKNNTLPILDYFFFNDYWVVDLIIII